MKTVKMILEVNVPSDTKLTDFAIVAAQVKDVLARVGYSSRLRFDKVGFTHETAGGDHG